MSSIYDSTRLAKGYAYDRPRVHERIVERIAARLPSLGVHDARRALDIGCGAGRSTAALAPLARAVVGIEPARTMLRHAHDVAPKARFLVACAEALPFASASFDIVAAAGSINYADLDAFLPSVGRVLAPDGVLVVYDFSAGRRLDGDARLDAWFAAFERRFPFPPGYETDVRGIGWDGAGLRLAAYEEVEVRVGMTAEAYLAYVLTETNVELALSRGADEEAIRRWCAAAIEDIFSGGTLEILFDGYAAYVLHQTARSHP